MLCGGETMLRDLTALLGRRGFRISPDASARRTLTSIRITSPDGEVQTTTAKRFSSTQS